MSKKRFKTIRKNKTIYLMLIPHFLFFTVFFLIPVIWCFYLGFFNYNLFDNKFILFDNYIQLLTNHPLFKKALLNTAKYAIIFVPLWLGKAIIIAGVLQYFKQKTQSFFKAAFYLPHVTSSIIIAMIWLWIYNPNFGLFNYILNLLGINNVLWLGNPNIALYAIIFMQFIVAGGSSIVMFSAAMASIPKDIYEAAEIDGASKLKIFTKITLPMLKPVIIYHIIIGLISSFQVFSNIYVMTKGGPQFSTVTILYLIYETAFENYNFGLAAAQSVILAIMISVISIINYKFIKKY